MQPSTKMRRLLVFTVMVCAAVIFILSETPVLGKGMTMPRVIILDHIQKQYSPVKFDHAAHVPLATGCGQCHHMHNDKQNSTCKECHAINSANFKATVKEGFLPCSACHTSSSAESPEMPGLKVALHKKCFECHKGMGDLGASPQGCVKTCHTRNQ